MDEAESGKIENAESVGSRLYRVYTSYLTPTGTLLTILTTLVGAIIVVVRWHDNTDRRIDALEAEKKGIAPAIMSPAMPDARVLDFQHGLEGLKSAQNNTQTYLAALDERIKKLENMTSPAAVGPSRIAHSQHVADGDVRCNPREQWNSLKACLNHPCVAEGNGIACTITLTNTGLEKYFHFGRSDDRTAPSATIYTRRSNNYNATLVRVGDRKDSGVDIIDNYDVDVTYSFSVPVSEDHINTMAVFVWSAAGPALQDNDMLVRINDLEIIR